jgi:hypothetical protein
MFVITTLILNNNRGVGVWAGQCRRGVCARCGGKRAGLHDLLYRILPILLLTPYSIRLMWLVYPVWIILAYGGYCYLSLSILVYRLCFVGLTWEHPLSLCCYPFYDQVWSISLPASSRGLDLLRVYVNIAIYLLSIATWQTNNMLVSCIYTEINKPLRLTREITSHDYTQTR